MDSPTHENLNPLYNKMLAMSRIKNRRFLLLSAAAMLALGLHLLMLPALVIARGEIDTVPDARQQRPEMTSKVVVIEFTGEITNERQSYFQNRFLKAKAEGCDVLLVEIDSPGGLKDASLDMARMIRDCDWAYTAVFVGNEAISGGALMSLGCDELFIAPNANFGDIGEIGFDSEEFAWRLIEPKIESYLSSKARALAQSKGRSPELAESMVDKDVLVYTRASVDGEKAAEFMITRVDAAEKPDASWTAVPEAGAERFLTLSGARAKQLGIAQRFATSRDEVLQTFDGAAQGRVIQYKHKTSDSVAYFLNYPFISGVILLVGLIALYIEFSAPGIGVGGLVATLCATLFFWSHFTGGTAGWMEVILFVAGIVFLLAELFVIPGFGVAGIMGIGLLFASVVLSGQSFVIPASESDWNQTLTTFLTLLAAGIGFFVAAFFIASNPESLPLLSSVVLASERVSAGETGTSPPANEAGVVPGDVGTATSLLRPSGRASFNGRFFDVVSDGSFVEQGAAIEVLRVAGNRITVVPVMEDAVEGIGSQQPQ